ncbi:MAG: transglutaminase family protein [Candidatus Hydrogenedentes bacterium]|nr:transglutaminase family protein [Candidatus Hydrogenedentota bacterium]
MVFHVEHTTMYRYSLPVALDPHIFRFRPRSDATQRLIQFAIEIEPKPTGQTQSVDLDGNAALNAWFGGVCTDLRVHSRFAVETLRANPFDFIIADPLALKLPLRFTGDIQHSLAPYRVRSLPSKEVDRFAESIAARAGHETMPFLTTLTAALYEGTRKIIREQGPPHAPEHTLKEKTGSCRDLSVLFMDACRAMGIPARFVSGYWHADTEREKRHLHAWVEVYLPGGGWRGFDPSKGLAVSDQHVAIAAAPVPAGAAPVSGTFRGPGVEPVLDADIRMRCE